MGGARTILLYLEEIVSLARAHLDSARWGMKHAAALSIADAADSVGGDMKLPQQELVWPALEQALAGKTWEGKEKVLEAFVKFAGQSSQLQNSDSGIAERMKKVSPAPWLVFLPLQWRAAFGRTASSFIVACTMVYHTAGSEGSSPFRRCLLVVRDIAVRCSSGEPRLWRRLGAIHRSHSLSIAARPIGKSSSIGGHGSFALRLAPDWPLTNLRSAQTARPRLPLVVLLAHG